MMPTSNQNSINALIRDLIDLIPAPDAAVGYWASDALDQLTQLGALDRQNGFSKLNLADIFARRDDPALGSSVNAALKALGKISELLEHGSIRRAADSESNGAASRIYSAFREVENRAAAH